MEDFPKVSRNNLLTPQYHLQLFKVRAQKHVFDAAMAFSAKLAEGNSFDEAWIAT